MELFEDIPMVCCQGPGAHCICERDEAMLRRYAGGDDLRPMCPREVEWCIDEADRCGEGFYNRAELEGMSHRELAGAVMNAWRMYVQSNCL